MARAFAEGIFFNNVHDHINMGLEKCRFQKSRLGYGYVLVQREMNAKRDVRVRIRVRVRVRVRVLVYLWFFVFFRQLLP